MLSAVPEKVFDWAIGIVSALLVSLTLYTAYFGVFPDGLQRSAHLLLAMALVYIGALRALVSADGSSGLNTTLKKLWILLVLAGGIVTTGHHIVNFDAIHRGSPQGELRALQVQLCALSEPSLSVQE